MKHTNAPIDSRFGFVALLLFLLTPFAVHAGTPLICHPYDIGQARSLPGGDWKGADPKYDRTHLVRDTLALLTPDTPVLVRMETLRRAAIYATANLRGWGRNPAYTEDDRTIANALLNELRQRTATTGDENRALALFDVGFLAETLRQAHLDSALDGYPILMKVAAMRPDDPDIAFALALASAYPKRKEHAQHLATARAAAPKDSLLAANVDSHFGK